jgi:hypothetical protein
MFLLAQLIEATIEAQSVMTAYHLATFRAAPLCCFLFQESPHAMLFYEFKVLYHAHMVKGAVALIEGL